MGKKWSCPVCEYKSGRRSNVGPHIGRKHDNSVVPVLTEFRDPVLPHQAYSRYYSDPYFPSLSRQDFTKDSMKKKEEDSFISTYKFAHRGLAICSEFSRAWKLPDSQEKNLILQDSVYKMERFVSSNPDQIWRDLFKIMTFSKIILCQPPGFIPAKRQSEVIKPVTSQHPDNDDSHPGSNSNSNFIVATSSDKHRKKLQIALGIVLEYKKERVGYNNRIDESGDPSKTRKTGKKLSRRQDLV